MTIISVNETGDANGVTTKAQFYEGAQKITPENEADGKVLVDQEVFWRLRRDIFNSHQVMVDAQKTMTNAQKKMEYAQKLMTELLNRMRFIHE
ncbi:hypothetical protein [Xenorhabdus innexi]|uniref:Uncharacterized protein n=1 Tax=Xenorhabdus innexi TaxID=290109 RepID=A0A1N6MWX5_9GAMM|nr:hypothetical protein [Xenorhabdus innexi]PHM33339.1 hypothetical protein Xinn_02596 [Xenorhabdus innexi]SIP73331.1 hypothetical protein XIS1_1800054 [Xenorhabdus innexi]